MSDEPTTKPVIMNPLHPEWDRFCELLGGPEGCDFKEERPGDPHSITWRCGGGHSQVKAQQILVNHFPTLDVDRTLAFFTENGGHCDCEILFNVQARVRGELT